MSRELLVKTGTQIRFCIAGSFSPADDGTNWTIGTPTDVALTQASLANGAARQSAKFDFGAAWAEQFALFGCADFTGETPTIGKTVDYYLAPSTHATAGNGNVAGNSGADAACPGGALGTILLAEFLKLCLPIGSLTVHDGACVQNGYVNVFSPPARYNQLVVVNNSGDAFESDDVENHAVINALVRELQ